MDAHKLHIGDFVKYRDTIVRVTSIYTKNGSNKIGFGNDDKDLVDADILQPIPVTAEMLLNNEFEEEVEAADPTFPKSIFVVEVEDEYWIEISWYDSHEVYESNTGQYLHLAPEEWGIEIWSKNGNYDCIRPMLYVHELQHMFQICGINREIILY